MLRPIELRHRLDTLKVEPSGDLAALCTILRPREPAGACAEGEVPARSDRYVQGHWSNLETILVNASGKILLWAAGRCARQTVDSLVSLSVVLRRDPIG